MAFRYQEPDHGFTFFWRIKKFDIITRSKSNCSYDSEVFEVPILNYSNWHLRLEHDNCENSLCLWLFKENYDERNSNIDIEMSILTSSGWSTRFCDFFKFKPGTSKGTSDLVDWNRRFSIKNHLIDGCVTVSCHMSNGATCGKYEQRFLLSKIKFNWTISHSSILTFDELEQRDVANFSIPPSRVSEVNVISDLTKILLDATRNKIERKPEPVYQKATSIDASTQTEMRGEYYSLNDTKDLLKLLKDKQFQYITLRTSSKDFAVHKALLCAKSTVFNDMFRGNVNMKNDIVDIDNVDSDTLSLLLKYLQMESLPIDDLEWDAIVKLYHVADKYQIMQLKKECVQFLKKNTTDENVCDAVILEDMERYDELQGQTENLGEKNKFTSSYGNWCF